MFMCLFLFLPLDDAHKFDLVNLQGGGRRDANSVVKVLADCLGGGKASFPCVSNPFLGFAFAQNCMGAGTSAKTPPLFSPRN